MSQNLTPLPLEASPKLWFGRIHHAEKLNAAIIQQFKRIEHDPTLRRSHKIEGRFENVYVDVQVLPELDPLIRQINAYACEILQRKDLKFGCWINAMPPGSRTSLHDHAELDELLSAVYYLNAPENSGDLLLREHPCEIRVAPEAGLCVFFEPDLAHEVATNESQEERISLAFNFGPVDSI